LIANREVRLASLMDHTPGQGQYTTEELFRTYIKRTVHRSDAEIDELLESKKNQIIEIPHRIESITRQAREAGIALATHDDDTAEKVEQWPTLGITIAEFPTTMAAAKRAHELGLAVCMGAPNVLRGKSSGGNLSALEAIQAGICDVLCSDYYPSAMLTAAFKLTSQQLMSLPQAIQMVSLRPAQAVGLGEELGSLEIGKLADLLIVRLERHPKVRRVFVSGRERLVHG
jgi:alpha-D-ribose 1-methylphosphonate 5-triphosphate diphosphatase